MIVAFFASINVHTGDGHCRGVQIVCQDALVTHGCMGASVNERVWLQAYSITLADVLVSVTSPWRGGSYIGAIGQCVATVCSTERMQHANRHYTPWAI